MVHSVSPSSFDTPFSPRALDRGLTGTMLSIVRHTYDPFAANDGAGAMNSPSRKEMLDTIGAVAARTWEVTEDSGKKTLTEAEMKMRTKNGKSFVVHWFPRTEAFAAVVEDWVARVTDMGLRPNDALFPEIRMLQQAADPERRQAIEPMQSISAVTDAFRLASRGATQDYSPHSARHTLAHLGDQLCRTGEQRKAWSLNLGHSSEAITWAHYGKISDTRRDEVFEAFDEEAPATSTEAELMLTAFMKAEYGIV